jgi:hypothetical protein
MSRLPGVTTEERTVSSTDARLSARHEINYQKMHSPRTLIAIDSKLLLILGAMCTALVMSVEAVPLVFVQVPVERADSGQEDAYTPRPVMGSRIVRYDFDRRSEGLTNLTADFAGAQDPEVSFDGQRILFAGKRTESDSWNIWEMRADGTHKQCLVNQPGDDFQPVFTGCLNTLDEGQWDQILFVSTVAGMFTEDGKEEATALYTCRVDGTFVHRISYNMSSDFDPVILRDGRVLFTSWQQNAGRYPPVGLLPLFAMCTDSAELVPFYGNQQMPRMKRMARETFDGYVVFVESDSPEQLGGGGLARVCMRRNLRSHEVLAEEPDGLYHSPCPLPGGDLLVSYRSRRAGSTYGIYRLDVERRRRGEVLFDDPEWHDVDVQVLKERYRPRGRSTVVDYGKPTGFVYCLDCYETDRPRIADLAKGSVKRLRVIEGVPRRTGSAVEGDLVGFGPRRILGDVPVEADGSFNLEVPAMIPFYVQTLNEDGLAIETLESWIWVMPMERRGCIGCHEDRERTPPNRFVDAVKRRAWKLTLPPERRRTAGFQDYVWPILEASCLRCHGRPDAVQNWSGGPRRAYENLLKARANDSDGGLLVQPGRARSSRLIWALFGRQMDGPNKGQEFKAMPRGGSLGQFDRQAWIEWVDLGAPWESPRTLPAEERAER